MKEGIDWILIKRLQQKRLNSYHWVRTEYDKLLWVTKSRTILSFKNIFDPTRNITKTIFERYDLKINGKIEDHAITSIKGETGSGKSMFSLALAVMLFGNKFNIDFVQFTNNSILELCKNIQPKRMAIQDEQPESIGMGSYREAVEMKNLEEITRKHQLSLIFNAPTERVHDTAHFNFEIIEKSVKERVTHVAVYDRKIEQYLGFMIMPILPENHPLIIAYKKKKDDFIQNTLKRASTRLDMKTMVENIKNHPQILKIKNKKHLIVIIKELFPILTIQEHAYIADYYELYNPINTITTCEKCKKNTLKKYKDTFKCYTCGWIR